MYFNQNKIQIETVVVSIIHDKFQVVLAETFYKYQTKILWDAVGCTVFLNSYMYKRDNKRVRLLLEKYFLNLFITRL